MAAQLPTALLIDFFVRLREVGAQHDRGVVPLITGDLLLQLWCGAEVIKANRVEVAFVPIKQQDYWYLPDEMPRVVSRADDPQVMWDGQPIQAGRKLTAAGYARTLCALAAELESYPVLYPRARFHFQRQYRLPAGIERTALWWQYDRSGRYLVGWRCGLPTAYAIGGVSHFDVDLTKIAHHDVASQEFLGELPINVSAPTSYTMADIATDTILVTGSHEASIELPTWSPEMFLAHKIAHTIQEHDRRSNPNSAKKFEPLRLFQTHLLLSRCDIDRQKLIECLQAIAREQLITKPQFFALLNEDSRLISRDFSADEGILAVEENYDLALVLGQMTKWLSSIVGQLQIDAESQFLQQLNNNEQPEAVWLIYADWLEEQGDARCEFLRKLAAWRLQPETHSKSAADELWRGLNNVSTDWLQRVLGGVKSYNRQWIEFAAVVSNWR